MRITELEAAANVLCSYSTCWSIALLLDEAVNCGAAQIDIDFSPVVPPNPTHLCIRHDGSMSDFSPLSLEHIQAKLPEWLRGSIAEVFGGVAASMVSCFMLDSTLAFIEGHGQHTPCMVWYDRPLDPLVQPSLSTKQTRQQWFY